MLNISVRVTRVNAAELKRLRAELVALQSAGGSANRAAAGINSLTASTNSAAAAANGLGASLYQTMGRMEGFAKRGIWTGRQLTMFFTLPLVALATVGVQTVLDVERAFTRLDKVYSNGVKSTTELARETEILGQTARVLSDYWGVAQADVLDAMAAFAAAGSGGTGLQNLTDEALRFSILADTDLQTASKQLILLVSQFGLTTNNAANDVHDLTYAVNLLNIVENETQVSMTDLLKVIERAGGAAATAGVGLNELAASAAAVVNVAGTAERGGRFLNTALSRIMKPGSESKQLLQELGIEINNVNWESLTWGQRISQIAERYGGLTQAQKVQAAATLFGTDQMSRGITLFEDFIAQHSRFQRVIEITSDAAKMEQVALTEVNKLLESDPRKLEIAMTRLQNAIAEVAIPLLPHILTFVETISAMVRAFNELDPRIKAVVVGGLTLLALFGPLYMAGHAVVLMFIEMGKAAVWLSLRLATLSAWFIGWPLIIAAAAVAIYVFRDEIAAALDEVQRYIENHVDEWWNMMTSIANAVASGVSAIGRAFASGLNAIVNFVADVVTTIWEWLSYLNPFAEHSPSLVAQVDAGIDAILDKYEELTAVRAPLRQAAASTQAFLDATSEMRHFLEGLDLAEQREGISLFAPDALDEFDEMHAQVATLRTTLAPLAAAIDHQESVVEQWERAVQSLDIQLEAANDRLDSLRDHAQALSDQLSAAKDRLAVLANTPITGMRAMSDEIFANEMAVKALQLAIMNFEDAHPEIEDLTERFALLNGEIEDLRAREKELRLAGATGDILAPLQQQAAALEAQRDAMMNASSGPSAELEAMRKELERLQREGQRLDLENSLKFDPLTRQIERLVNGMNELPFEEIVAGIQREQANITSLTAAHDQATAAVREQEGVVHRLQEAREAANASLDAEKQKLSDLKDAYRAVEDQIGSMVRAIENLTDVTDKAAKAAKAGREGVLGAPGEFESARGPGGGLGPGGGADEMRKRLDELANRIKGMNPFAVIGDAMRGAWARVRGWWDDGVDWLSDRIPDLPKIDWGAVMGLPGEIKQRVVAIGSVVIDGVVGAWQSTINFIRNNPLSQALAHAFGPVVAELSKWGVVFRDIATIVEFSFKVLGAAIWVVWTVAIQPALTLIGDAWNALSALIASALSVITNVITENFDGILKLTQSTWQFIWEFVKIIWDTIGAYITGTLQIIRGVIGVFANLIRGDWAAVWDSIKLIFEGFWTIIRGIAEGAMRFLWDLLILRGWNVIRDAFGLAVGVMISLFQNLLSETLRLGGMFLGWFAELPGRIIGYFAGAGTWLFNAGRDVIVGIWNGLNDAWPTIHRWLYEMPGRIGGFFLGTGEWLVDAGKDLMRGLWEGIKSMGNWLKDKIGGLAGDVIGWAKGGFGIFSPSRLMAEEVGKPIAQGIALGIERNLGAVRDAIDVSSLYRKYGTFSVDRGMLSSMASAGGSSVSKSVNIYGNLEFPNITSGEDAESFVRNLESLS